MERDESWGRERVMSELIEGMKLSKKLKEQLIHNSKSSNCGLLIEDIVSCYDKALAQLSYATVSPQNADSTTKTFFDFTPTTHVSNLQDRVSADVPPKNRKRRSKEVHACSEIRFEGEHEEDGYNWRKYGQKHILGASHPRSYYRCTHRHRRGCLATKHVQRGEDEPPTFNIVCRGKHTCDGLKLKKENDDEKVAAPLVSEPTSQSYSDIIDYDHSFLNSALRDLDFLIDFDAAAAFLDVSHHYL